ncbi:acyl-CoA dehydrogenase family protein [Streptomyces nojiriensis]
MSGLAWTPEQEELRDAVRAVLARHPGHEAWAPLTTQVGAAALAVPEEYGGLGCGPAEVGVVMSELGRALSPVPYLGSAVLTVQALLASGDTEACARHLPGLAEGSLIGALAWAESPRGRRAGTPGAGPTPVAGLAPSAGSGAGTDAGSDAGAGAGAGAGRKAGPFTDPGVLPGPRPEGWEATDLATRAEPDGDGGWLLTGTKQYVLAGPAEPSLILAFATLTDGPAPLGLFELTAPPAAYTPGPPWTAPVPSPSSPSPGPRPGCSRPTAPESWPGSGTWPARRWPPNRPGPPRGRWSPRSNTRRTGTSSAGPSAPSRP